MDYGLLKCKKIKILLAEDELLIAQYLKIELELNGYTICNFVASGEEAIEITKEEKSDIILIDIHLSGKMDGIEAARQIVALKDISIIFMTGYNEVAIYKQAQKINPVAYLEKPIEVHDIIPIIESLFK
ncbi:MAG: response regulator [Candidatus Cloacimonadota bacterium]|nr:response regulator [Candidatus Cloacimonadota bacterium]